MIEDTDRTRLVKILRMFSSHHDGEVAAAARQAHRLVKDRALDWDDLIIPISSQQQSRQQQNYSEDEPTETELIQRCSERMVSLTVWEREFILSIRTSVHQWGHLTEKQRGVLNRIVIKLKATSAWDDDGSAGGYDPDF